ncbi:MAG: calcium-binding protein [Alphaproteobacteria bacterium]
MSQAPSPQGTPASLSFTFHGVVETVATEFPNRGAAGFGFAEGEHVTATLALSGATAAGAAAAVGGGTVFVPVDPDEVALDVPIPRRVNWDERFIAGTFDEADTAFLPDVFLFAAAALDRPLDGLKFLLANGDLDPDGPNGRVDQSEYRIRLTDDDDNEAAMNGLWLPDGVALNRVYGTADADILRGTGDLNAIWGLEGDDQILVKSGVGYAWGGFGDDTIKGNDGGDVLIGWSGDDRILGRRGDDSLLGGDGNDLLRGEPGDDVLRGGRGDDSLKGGSGDDLLFGDDEADILQGNDGTDSLDGGFGDDTIDGGSGDDVIVGGNGDDTLDGGPGDDLFLFDVRSDNADTILGFRTGAGSDDVVRIANYAGDLADLFAGAFDGPDGAVFNLRAAPGSFVGLTFVGRAVADFDADDFVLV